MFFSVILPPKNKQRGEKQHLISLCDQMISLYFYKWPLALGRELCLYVPSRVRILPRMRLMDVISAVQGVTPCLSCSLTERRGSVRHAGILFSSLTFSTIHRCGFVSLYSLQNSQAARMIWTN